MKNALKNIKASWNRFLHSLNAKNSSMFSLSSGVLGVILVYLLDILVRGAASWTVHFSVNAWLIAANIMLILLPLLALCAAFFGIVGIKRAIKGKSGGRILWISACIVGILLGVLPLLLGGIVRSMWFKILYF